MASAWKWITGVLMTASILLAFTYSPVATRPNFGTGKMEPWPEFRIFFFHVPAAWIATLGFLVAMIWSIRYLRKRDRRLDDVALASSELGFVFCAVALLSGMIWARREWGAFWNWDPRQNTVLILLLIYGGYFTLRSAVSDEEKRRRMAAVYSIFAFVTVPFLVFIVPRIMETLHPSPIIKTDQQSGVMNAKMRQVFYLFLLSYTALYVWVLGIRVRVERLTRSSIEAFSGEGVVR
jgi:heme exporter protein C